MSEFMRIEISNFQSHANTSIEPAPAGGLTVITGPSDSGKTAIVRALKWLLYNHPQGDNFRRVGCDYVEVSVETASGQHVTRRRTSTTNRYIVDGQTLEGFGSSVPAEIQLVTGVRSVRLGDQDILANIAGQLEPPFLGSSISAPARAKVLGKLAGTEVIDQASRDLGTDLYRSRQEAKRLEAGVEELEQQVAQYDYLPNLASRLEGLKELAQSIEAAQQRMNQVRPYRQKLLALYNQRGSQWQTLCALGNPEQAAVVWENAELVTARRKQLARLMSQLLGVDQQTRALDVAIRAVGSPEQATVKLDEAQSNQSTLQKLIPLNRSLNALRRSLTDAYETVGRTAGAEVALASWQAAGTAASKLGQLQRLSSTLTQVVGQQEFVSNQLTANNQIANLGLPVPELSQLRQLKAIGANLNDTRQAYDKAIGAQELAIETLDRATRLYSEALKEAGRCPVCGNEIKDNCIEEVLSA